MKKERNKQMLIKLKTVQSHIKVDLEMASDPKIQKLIFNFLDFLWTKIEILGIICEIMVNMGYHNMNLGFRIS